MWTSLFASLPDWVMFTQLSGWPHSNRGWISHQVGDRDTVYWLSHEIHLIWQWFIFFFISKEIWRLLFVSFQLSLLQVFALYHQISSCWRLRHYLILLIFWTFTQSHLTITYDLGLWPWIGSQQCMSCCVHIYVCVWPDPSSKFCILFNPRVWA